MGHADELDVEGTNGAAPAERYDMEGKPVDDAALGKLRLEHFGGEGRGINGDAAKKRPEIGHGAEMILVRMSEQKAGNVVPFLFDEADIRENDVDAWLIFAA